MKHKFDSLERFKKFKSEVKKQTRKSIMTLWFDRCGEYLGHDFQDYLKENRILS
jgi:hypothetical protein